MPEPSCLPGSRPVLDHHGPVCEVADCNTSSDCVEGVRLFPDMNLDPGICQQRRVCVQDITYAGRSGIRRVSVRHTVVVGDCDGEVCREDRAPYESPAYIGYADADGWTLVGDARCEELNVCAPAEPFEPELRSTPHAEDGCDGGCNSAPGARFSLAVMLLLMVNRRVV